MINKDEMMWLLGVTSLFVITLVIYAIVYYRKSKEVSGIPSEANYRWEPVTINGVNYKTKIKVVRLGIEKGGWFVSFFKDQTGGYMAAKTCKELIAELESKFNIKSVGEQIEALIKNGNLRKKHKGE
jgi:hypothetical protein